LFNFFEYNTHPNEHLSKAIEREDDCIYSNTAFMLSDICLIFLNTILIRTNI